MVNPGDFTTPAAQAGGVSDTVLESSRSANDNSNEQADTQTSAREYAQELLRDSGGNVQRILAQMQALTERVTELESSGNPAFVTPLSGVNALEDEGDESDDLDEFTDMRNKATAAVGAAFATIGARNLLTPLQAVYDKVTVARSTYNSTWATNIPQLHAYFKGSKEDPMAPLRDAKEAEAFTAALQRVTSTLELTHGLTLSNVVCVLLCEMESSGDALVKQKAEDIALCCLKTNDLDEFNQVLKAMAQDEFGGICADLPYGSDYAALPGGELLRDGSTRVWLRILVTMTQVWTRIFFVGVSPDEAKYKWSSIKQKKNEWMNQYLARERQRWQELQASYNFRKLQVPSSYDRVVQLLSSVQADMRKAFSAFARREHLVVEDLTYEVVANKLLSLEHETSMAFPWDWDKDSKTPFSAASDRTKTQDKKDDDSGWSTNKSGGKWDSKGDNKENGGDSGSKAKGGNSNPKGKPKAEIWCSHCYKYTSHNDDKCWRNPSNAANVPDWFRKKFLDKPKDKDAKTDSAKEAKDAPMFMANTGEDDPLAVPAIHARLLQQDGGVSPMIIGVDTLSEYNLIDTSLADHCLEETVDDLPTLAGFRGNKFKPTRRVIVEMSIGGKDLRVKALVIDMDPLCVDMGMVLGAVSMANMHAGILLGDRTFRIDKLRATVPITTLERRAQPDAPFLACPTSDETEDDEVEAIMRKSDDQLLEEARARLKAINYKSPVMQFSIPEAYREGLFQCSAPYNVPSGLVNGVKHKIEKEIDRGHWKRVQRDNDLWISPAFAKDKQRPIPDGPYAGSSEVRLLIDLRKLNDLVQIPDHYHYGGATIEDFTRNIPSDSAWFTCVDIESAFESMDIDPESSKLFCFNIMGEIIQSVVALQGFAYSALFWVYHLRHGLQAALGPSFKTICAVFVDDILVFGRTYRECLARRRVVVAALKALLKIISPKTSDEITQEIECVGLRWSKNGVCLNTENEKTLREALATKPKGSAQLRRLLGSINFAQGAFPGFKMRSELGEAKKVLHGLVNVKPFRLTDQGEAALSVLRSNFANLPLALHSYDELIDGEGQVWVIMCDASDLSIGGALYRYHGTAIEVDADAVQQIDKSFLCAVFSKGLTQCQQAWATYEKEVYSVMVAMSRWFRLVVATTRPSPATTGGGLTTPKVVILTDSMVCLYRWKDYRVPESPLSSVKSRRFLGWCETVSGWRSIPYVVKHCKGLSNDFADLLSRWMAAPTTGPPETTDVPKPTMNTSTRGGMPTPSSYNDTLLVKPFMVNLHQEDSSPDDEPRANEGVRLSQQQAQEVRRALLVDDSTYLGVRLKDIYTIAAEEEGDVDIPEVALKRVKKWIEDKYFVMRETAGEKLLYTTPVIRKDMVKEAGDNYGDYVMVVPGDCNINVVPQVAGSERFDMRQSILYMNHDTIIAAHGSETTTLRSVLTYYWWPSLVKDIRNHRLSCAICQPSSYLSAVGTLPTTRERFKVYSIDFKEIPEELKSRLKLNHEAAIMSCIDLGTGEVTFEYVKDHSVYTVCLFLWTKVIARHGPPAKVCSDQAASFVSAVVAKLAKLFGFTMKTSASRNPTGNSRIERAHKSLGFLLQAMLYSGDGADENDLKVYLAAAEARANFKLAEGEELSVHAAVYGQGPNGFLDEDQEKVDDSEYTEPEIDGIFQAATYACATLADLRDLKAHYNVGYRLTQSHMGKVPKLKEGDRVLHQNVGDEIVKVYVADNNNKPTVAILKSGCKVPINELRPYPEERPIHLGAINIKDDKVAEGEYALIKVDGDKKVSVAKILKIEDDDDITVHICDGGAKSSVFLPLWKVGGDYKRSTTTPTKEANPVVRSISKDDIIFKVELNASSRMTPRSKDRMLSLNVEMASTTST